MTETFTAVSVCLLLSFSEGDDNLSEQAAWVWGVGVHCVRWHLSPASFGHESPFVMFVLIAWGRGDLVPVGLAHVVICICLFIQGTGNGTRSGTGTFGRLWLR